MNKEFVPYEIALELKKLGFDEICFATWKEKIQLSFKYCYLTNKALVGNSLGIICTAPLYQQVFRFFREKWGLSSSVHLAMSDNKRKIWYNIHELDNRLVSGMYFKSYPKGMFKTYEQAELECLKKLIEICKKKN